MRLAGVTAAIALALAASQPALAAPKLTKIATVAHPVYLTAPPQDAHRLFVVRREGVIITIRDGVTLNHAFLDLTDRVVFEDGERGMASMAFAPDYATSGLFYVFYTAASADPVNDPEGVVLMLDEFRASGPDNADPASRRNLLAIDHPGSGSHNGGQLQFGADGKLYLSVGDGQVTAADAQDPTSLLGKLLRVDPASGAVDIVASGLRNPWRFSFDRLTHRLVLSDVGEQTREEVNLVALEEIEGSNFGWPCWEGTLRFANPPCDPPGYVPPVFEFGHEPGECASITGGYVVRHQDLPSLVGRYLYTDFCGRHVRADVKSVALSESGATGDSVTGVASLPFGPTSFGEDSCGHVYLVHLMGPVWRIDDDEVPYVPCPDPPPPPQDPPQVGPSADPPKDGGPPADPPVTDARAPALVLTRARVQKVLRTGVFVVGARCDEPCRLKATGAFSTGTPPKTHGARHAKASAGAGERTKLRLRVKSAGLRALRRALERRERVVARISVTAVDAVGNPSTGMRMVRVRR